MVDASVEQNSYQYHILTSKILIDSYLKILMPYLKMNS